MTIVDLALVLVRGQLAKTSTKLELLLSQFDSVHPPQEVSRLRSSSLVVRQLSFFKKATWVTWATKHRNFERLLGFKYRSAVYYRRTLLSGVTVYEPKHFTQTILCFTGHAGRMMVPLPLFLAALWPSKSRVILVCRKGSYKAGIPGMTPDISSSLSELYELLNDRNLLPSSVIGASGGCLPALLFASNFHESKVFMFGPSNPRESEIWEDMQPLEEFARFSPTGLSIVGLQSEKDRVAAGVIERLFPKISSQVVVDAGHNSLLPLIQRQEFHKLNRFLVSGDRGSDKYEI